MFLDGVFFTKFWLNGTLVSDTPRDLEIVGTGVTFDSTTGRAQFTLPAGSGGGGAAGGGTGELQYNNGGALDGASGIKIGASEAQLAFSGTVTVGGSLNFPQNTKIARGRNALGGGDVDLLGWGIGAGADRLLLGDSAALAGLDLLIKTGGDFAVKFNGTTAFDFAATALTLSGASVTGATFFAAAGTVPSSGYLRIPNGGAGITGISSINVAGTTSFRLIGTGSDDAVYVGGGSNTGVYLVTGGNINFRPANSATNTASLSSTVFDLVSTVITQGTGTRANLGIVRLAKNPGVTIAYIAHDGATTRNALEISGDGTTFTDVLIGDDNATTGNSTLYIKAKTQAVVRLAGTNEFVFGVASLDVTNNSIQFGTNPSNNTGHLLRVPHNAILIGGRDSANATNGAILRWGTTGANMLTLGDDSLTARIEMRMLSGSFDIDIAGVTEFSASSTAFDFKDNFAQYGTNPATAGTNRHPNNTSIIVARNAANSANMVLLATDSSNNTYIGDRTNSGNLILGAGSAIVDLNGMNLVMNSGIITFANIGFLSTAAATGWIRIAHNMSNGLIVGRNNAGSADVKLLDWGVAGTDIMRVGPQSSGTLQFTNVSTGFFGGTGTTKQTITGSRGTSPATVLANLLTALAGYGLLTDSTTA